jgi:hypothetical protein
MAASVARAAEVVQIPVDGVLDARPVATLTGGMLVPWTVGIDQDDGFITTAAATSLHQTGPALPDDGVFAADADHPEVRLHFSNDAPATSPQARSVTGAASFEIDVPASTYETLYLFLTSSYGSAKLEVTFGYADATSTKVAFTMPDWGTGAALPAGPPTYFNLVSGLHKWTKAGASVDTPTHALAGVTLSPAVDKLLVRITIAKVSAPERLTFWGVTGLVTSRPPTDGGDAGMGPAADAATVRDAAPEEAAGGPRDAAPADTPATAAPADTANDPPHTGGGLDGAPSNASADASPAAPAGERPRASGGCAVTGEALAGDAGLPLVFILAVVAARVVRPSSRRRDAAASTPGRS